MVVAVLAGDHLLEVVLHVAELGSEDLETLQLVADLLGESALRSISDVSKQVLNTDFFSLSSANGGRHMDKLTAQVAILIDLLLSEVSGSGKSDLSRLLDSANEVNGHGVVATKDLIDLDVVLLRVWAS